MRYFYPAAFAFILIFILHPACWSQSNRIDSLEQLLDTAGVGTRSRTLTELAWAYRNEDPEKGVNYGKEALGLLYKTGDKELQAECLLYIGVNYFKLNELTEAMDYFLQSMKIKEDLNDREGIAAILNNLGNISKEMANYRGAINYYEQALKIGESLQNSKITSTALANLAVSHKLLDDLDLALEYNVRALKIREEVGDEQGIAGSLNNIAIIYADSAFVGYDPALSLDHFQRSLAIKERIGDHFGYCQTLVNMGNHFTDLGQFYTALPYYEEALEIAQGIKSTSLVMACYAHLSDYYAQSGNFKKALDYQVTYTNLMDSVYIAENKQQMAEMMVRFETDKKEKENELLRQQAEIQILQINRQNYFRNFLIAMTVLLLGLAVAIYSRYVLKQRTNRLLEDKNRELALVNATKDKFFSIIAHDLKNPFYTLLQVSDQLRDRFHELDDDQKIRIISLIHRSAVLTHDLLANLLDWSVSQTGSIHFHPEKLDLSVLVDDCTSLLRLNAEKKGIRLVSDVMPGTFVSADRNMVATVLRNLLSNAVKYMEIEGEVRIMAQESGEMMEVRVQDEGIGICEEDIGKLFRIDVNTHQIGKSGEKGTGLGLILCKEFVEKHGGNIRVESEAGRGSIFIFTLPKWKP